MEREDERSRRGRNGVRKRDRGRSRKEERGTDRTRNGQHGRGNSVRGKMKIEKKSVDWREEEVKRLEELKWQRGRERRRTKKTSKEKYGNKMDRKID